MEDFDKIYNDTFDQTLKYVLFYCQNPEDINDIVQETYLSLFKAMEKNKEIQNLPSYIRGIASKKIKDHYRIHYRFKENALPMFFRKQGQEYDFADYVASDYNLEDDVIEKLELQEILKELRAKDPISFKILLLYYHYDMKIKEIAEILKMKESMVKNKLYGTIQRIKKKHYKVGSK